MACLLVGLAACTPTNLAIEVEGTGASQGTAAANGSVPLGGLEGADGAIVGGDDATTPRRTGGADSTSGGAASGAGGAPAEPAVKGGGGAEPEVDSGRPEQAAMGGGGPDSQRACAEGGEACEAGLGACRAIGLYECTPSGPRCSASPAAPQAEVCDTELDEDCDGRVDEAPPGSCCSDLDCNSGETCELGSSGNTCESVEPCGDGTVDFAAGEVCDPGERGTAELCSPNCRLLDAVYKICTVDSAECFPGIGIFDNVRCGAHQICTLMCSDDLACRTTGRAADAECVPYRGGSFCFDVCRTDADCPSDQLCLLNPRDFGADTSSPVCVRRP